MNNPSTPLYRNPLIIIAAAIAVLIVLGFIAIGDFTLSSSAFQHRYRNPWLYIQFQVVSLALGCLLGYLLFRLKEKLFRYALPLAAVGLLLGLAAALLPDSRIFPAYLHHRYALVFGVELRAAFWLLVFCLPLLASLLSRLEDGEAVKRLKATTVAFVWVICTLLLAIPDVPIFFLCSATLIAVLFLGGKPLRKITTVAFALVPFWTLLLYNVLSHDYRRERLTSFYYYFNDPLGSGFSTRLVRAELAQGGWFGQGMAFLEKEPTAIVGNFYSGTFYNWMVTDFILSVTGRQFGLIGVMIVILLFSIILVCGLRLVRQLHDTRRRNLSLFLLLFVVFQGFIGIARTLNLMPFLPPMVVPFLGFSRDMLIGNLMIMGLLFALVREGAPMGAGEREGAAGPAAVPPARFAIWNDRKVQVAATACVVFALFSLWHQRTEQISVHQQPTAQQRGQILDANGIPLAASVIRQSAWIDLPEARQAKARHPEQFFRFAASMETMIEGSGKRLTEQLMIKSFLWVKRYLSEDEKFQLSTLASATEYRPWAERVLRFLPEQGRLYPFRRLTSPLLGHINIDGGGAEGLELRYNEELSAGQNIMLGLDMRIQKACDRVLKRCVEKHRASGVRAIVLRVRDAQTLAVYTDPAYDPYDFQGELFKSMKLRPVTDLFQIGPLFHPFLLAELMETNPAALPEGQEADLLRQDQTGFRLFSENLGMKGMLAAAVRFELDRKTRIDFPGEGSPIVRKRGPEKELHFDLGHGYGVAASLMRTALSFNALINGGELTYFRFVEGVGDREKIQDLRSLLPDRVITEHTSSALRQMMTASVRKATDGWITDTGGFWATYFEKHDDRRLRSIGHVAGAFFTPADHPEYLVLFDMQLADESRSSAETDKDLGLQIGRDLAREITASCQ